MTFLRPFNKSNMTGSTSGEGTAYPSWAPGLASGLSGVVLLKR